MPTDVEREKIIFVIKNMKKQIASLKDDFEKIKATQKTLDLLNDFLAGEISISEEEAMRTTCHSLTLMIKTHEAIIKDHEKRNAQIKERLGNISLIKSFL